MIPLLILLTGVIGFYLDSTIPQVFKTVVWVLLVVFGIILGALNSFKV